LSGDGDIVVFAGPSLPQDQRPVDRRLSWRPPARAGDCFELDPASCRLVVLIDGFFGSSPAVRHKELLALMSRGIALLGAASMGALRAAELAPYGMAGIGRIYRAYARGRLVGDDEVALLHGPAPIGWAALTEPLVNVRATLGQAVRRRVLDGRGARLLLTLAAETFYQERTWPLLLQRAAEADVSRTQLADLAEWLPQGRLDLKLIDAQEAVRAALTSDFPTPRRPPPPATIFTAALAAQAPFRPPLD
jgi:hypothetical protein